MAFSPRSHNLAASGLCLLHTLVADIYNYHSSPFCNAKTSNTDSSVLLMLTTALMVRAKFNDSLPAPLSLFLALFFSPHLVKNNHSIWAADISVQHY